MVNAMGPVVGRAGIAGFRRASKLWISRWNPSLHVYQLLTLIRADSSEDKPQFDTIGGGEDDTDGGEVSKTLIRECLEEAVMPLEWATIIGKAIGSSKQSQCIAHLRRWRSHTTHQVHSWLILTPPDDGPNAVTLTKGEHGGQREAKPGSLQWRDVEQVTSNLDTFNTFKTTAEVIRQLVDINGWNHSTAIVIYEDNKDSLSESEPDLHDNVARRQKQSRRQKNDDNVDRVWESILPEITAARPVHSIDSGRHATWQD
jgi:hypothetical protein